MEQTLVTWQTLNSLSYTNDDDEIKEPFYSNENCNGNTLELVIFSVHLATQETMIAHNCLHLYHRTGPTNVLQKSTLECTAIMLIDSEMKPKYIPRLMQKKSRCLQKWKHQDTKRKTPQSEHESKRNTIYLQLLFLHRQQFLSLSNKAAT